MLWYTSEPQLSGTETKCLGLPLLCLFSDLQIQSPNYGFVILFQVISHYAVWSGSYILLTELERCLLILGQSDNSLCYEDHKAEARGDLEDCAYVMSD